MIPRERTTRLAAIFALSAFLMGVGLNVALFLPGEWPYTNSIGSGYGSMARMIARNPDPFGWNSLQYTGVPNHRIYLPVLPYVSAGVWKFTGMEPAYAFRVTGAFFLCMVPLTWGFLAWYFTRSLRWAAAAALAMALLSPVYQFIGLINNDRGRVQLPWRVQMQAQYGEAPHNTGVMLLPLAIVAMHRAGTRRGVRPLLAAGLLCALTALTNLIAALAMAYTYLCLLAACIGRRDFSAGRALAVPLLALLFAQVWLTPAFLESIASNWTQDAAGFRLRPLQLLGLVAMVGGLVLIRLLFRRIHDDVYPCFLALCFIGLATVVLTRYWLMKDLIPEAHRYVNEMEAFLLLLILELARRLAVSSRVVIKAAGMLVAATLIGVCLPDTLKYVFKPRAAWQPVPRESLNTYRVGEKVASLHPEGRVFATGSLRFRWNTWFDIPQATGNFETALLNRVPVHYQYQIVSGVSSKPGEDGTDAALQLKALGVEYVVLHRPDSVEYYKDFRNPEKFDGVLERVWEENGDVIYRVPFRSLAHLIRPDELPVDSPKEHLPPFVAALEDKGRPTLTARWISPGRLDISGDIPDGYRVVPLVSFDPGWAAYQNGAMLRMEKNQLGYLTLRASPGRDQTITLHYGGASAQKWGTAVSGLSLMAALGACIRSRG